MTRPTTLPAAQHGAGLLLAVVFLLVVISLFGGIALRMAGTDITDTAVQNDSVEALFMAESGLERAAQRLAAGATCDNAGLAEAARTLGSRGSFEIQSAQLVSGLCRVRVLGSAGLAGATPAQRLIEADLSLGGCRGWAVGNTSGGNEVFLCWDGSSWSRNGPYAAIPNTTLNSVTCPASNICWAVGNQSGGELIARWDGSAWTRIAPAGSIPNQHLFGVHCFDSSTCWAVGNNRTFVRGNNGAWSNGSPGGSFPNVRMNSVYCVDTDDCWAVGNALTTGAPASRGEVIARWTGGSWSRLAPDPALPDVNLLSISCSAWDDCWAVGAQSSGDVFLHWNGTSWQRTGPYPTVPNTTLNGIHCRTGSQDCWAVGNQSGGELIARWNTPNWTRSTYAGVTNRTLYGVFVAGASEAYVVGTNGLIAAIQGGTWANQASPVTSTLRAVTMAPSGGGGAVGVQRWREIIQ